MFKKSVSFTDLHFGRNIGSPIANQDNLDFLEWAIDEAKTWGAETAIMLGDWHDSRSTLRVDTLDYSLRAIEMLNNAFGEVMFIVGNHDLFYRDKRDIASTAFSRNLENIKLVNQPITIGEGANSVTYLPWLIGEEKRMLRNISSRYIFAHAELNGGFMMNEKVVVPDNAHSASPEDFVHQEFVFSGHYHFRQAKDNVIYIGNIMPFNFADEGDTERGIMLLEWGKDPEFRAWPGQPTFAVKKLSDILVAPERHLRDKMTVRASIDLDISYEESLYLRDEFVKNFGLRKLELIPPAKESFSEQDFSLEVKFQSIDQIVIEGLMSVDSRGVAPERLANMYNSLR